MGLKVRVRFRGWVGIDFGDQVGSGLGTMVRDVFLVSDFGMRGRKVEDRVGFGGKFWFRDMGRGRVWGSRSSFKVRFRDVGLGSGSGSSFRMGG